MCRWLSLVAASVLASQTPAALAQWARTIDQLVNRPGTRGPSQYIGGTFTRAGPTQPLAATRTNVSLMEQQTPQFRSRQRDLRHTAALGTAQVGARAVRGTRAGWAGVGAQFNDEIAVVSGLHAMMSRELKLPGVRDGYVPRVDAFLYTPRPEATRFHELTGLTPIAPPPLGPAITSTTAERLATETDELVRRAMADGLALFKQATVEPRTRDAVTGLERYQTCADCEEKLIRAVQLLRLARDLDTKAYLPPLLMAHAYLEQQRGSLALHQLLAALRREPRLFELSDSGVPFDEYFGDARNGRSAYLAAQMRRYVRIGDQSVVVPNALALSAYSAWRLGEYDVARSAAIELEALARDRAARVGHLLDLALALQAALPPRP